MTGIGDISVGFNVDTSGLKAGLDRAKNSVKGFGRSAEDATAKTRKLGDAGKGVSSAWSAFSAKAGEMGTKINDGLGGILPKATAAKVGVLGAAGAIAAGVAAAAKVIINALQKIWAKLTECVGYANQSYKAAQYFAGAFGSLYQSEASYYKQLAEEMGVNATDMMRYAAQIDTAFESAGVSATDAASRSRELTELGYDIFTTYSATGTTLADAMEIVKSIANGEVSAFSKLGLTVNDTTLQTYALSVGILKAGGSFTAAKKSAAAYQYAIENLQGKTLKYKENATDLDRVNASIDSSSKDLKTTLGQVFEPLVVGIKKCYSSFLQHLNAFMTKILNFISSVRGAIQGLADTFNSVFGGVISTLKGLLGMGTDTAEAAATAATDASEQAGSAAQSATDAADRAAEAVKSATGGLAAFDKLNSLAFGDDDTSEDTSAGGSGYDPDAAKKYVTDAGKIEQKMRNAFNLAQYLPDLGQYWQRFKTGCSDAWQNFKSGCSDAWNSAGERLSGFTSWLSSAGTAAWNTIKEAGKAAWTAISGTASAVWSAVSGWASGVWSSFTGWASGAWETVKTSASETWTKIGESLKSVFDGVKKYITETFTAVLTKLQEWVQKIKDTIDGVKNAAGNAATSAKDTVTNAVGGAYNWLKSKLGRATGDVVSPGDYNLALTGDNLTEREVISPLSTIRQAVSEALRDSGGLTVSSGQPIQVTIQLDGRTMAKAMYKYSQAEATRRGAYQ